MDGPGDVVRRRAGRVVVLDGDGRVLLQQGVDPDEPGGARWWMTPGGGVEPGETTAVAARREVWEETGLWLGDLGSPVGRRTARFVVGGQAYEQSEQFYVARLDALGDAVALAPQRLAATELASIVDMRWWTVAELRATGDTVYPPWLAELVESLAGAAAGPAGRSAGSPAAGSADAPAAGPADSPAAGPADSPAAGSADAPDSRQRPGPRPGQ